MTDLAEIRKALADTADTEWRTIVLALVGRCERAEEALTAIAGAEWIDPSAAHVLLCYHRDRARAVLSANTETP